MAVCAGSGSKGTGLDPGGGRGAGALSRPFSGTAAQIRFLQ
jgi:hypothetical protein